MLEAIIMAGIVAALARFIMKWRDELLVGLAFAAGHFHGREKRDYETSVQMQPPHLEGYYFRTDRGTRLQIFGRRHFYALVLSFYGSKMAKGAMGMHRAF